MDQDIWRRLQEQAEAANRFFYQNTELFENLEELGRKATGFHNDLQRVLGSVDWTKLIQPSVELGRLLDNTRVEDAFTSLGLIPSPSMEKGLIDSVVQEYERGTPPRDIHQMVLDHYDVNNAEPVARIVDRLSDSLDFVDRVVVLKDVLTAHRNLLDSITSYPLVAMIEGVLMMTFAPYVTHPKNDLRHNKLAEYFWEMPHTVTLGPGFEAVASMLAFMEGSLYHSSNWWDDEETRKNYIDLNRHRLLHGMAVRGTRLNTLRCFLMLDLISELLPNIREMFAASELDDEE